MSFTILTGKLFIWEEDRELLQLAEQMSSVARANSALQANRLTSLRGEESVKLIGLAMGKGTKEVTPVRLKLNRAGFPLFSCPVVVTTGRVEGLPGTLGYIGAKANPRYRAWIFSVSRPLISWRRQLGLAEIWGERPAVFRLAKQRNLRELRTQVYREIRDGGKYR